MDYNSYYSADPSALRSDEPDRQGEPFLARVTEAVNRALDQGGANVVLIAKEMHLTEQSFRRRFHKHTGHAPKAFFTAIQMERASRLLLDGDGMPVARVAIMCGFENSSSFCHKFKRFYGCAPSQYRDLSPAN